jgi:hypothetical protein
METERTMRPAIAGGIGTNEWNADAHRALSETYSVSAAIQNQAVAFAVVFLIWRLERRLRPLVKTIGLLQPKVGQQLPTKEQIVDGLATLRRLHSELTDMCDKFSEIINRHSLCRYLAASKITLVREYAECFLDLVDAAELSLDPDLDKKYFDKAIGELKRGETHSLESIF